MHRRIAKWINFAPFRRVLLWAGETRVGGKQIFASILRPVMKTATAKMGFADRSCLEVSHPEYTQKIVPEALKQQNAMPWIQDLALFLSPWPFDVRQIPEALQGATHLWHGTGDTLVRDGGLYSLQLLPDLGGYRGAGPVLLRLRCRQAGHSTFAWPSLPYSAGPQAESCPLLQVPDATTRAFQRLLPKVSSQVIDGGGHFAYFVCNPVIQKIALKSLLSTELT